MLSAAGPADSRALLLALIATACACPTWGGAPYRVLEEMADDLDAGGSFVEIGSDRGEGSTSWLSGFASRTGRDFFSVDFAPEGHENARRVCGVCAHRGLGEEFLSGDFSKVSKFGAISFAYLDNYDWVWAGEHPESYTEQFPAMISDDQMSQYKLKMRKEYEAEGYVLNNGRSQEAHLAQAKLVHSLCTARCIIIFDDTFQLGNGLYSGKGGAAMRYLLADERFEVVTQSRIEDPSYNGFVVVRRLASRPPGGQDDATYLPSELLLLDGEEEDAAPPLLEWTHPHDGAVVACCTATVSLKVTGAVNGVQHLVVFVDHLERFRRVDWANDDVGGSQEDLVSFDVPAGVARLAPGGKRTVALGAHILSVGRLKVLANTTIQFEFAQQREL